LTTALLAGLQIVQLGRGLAAAVCGRLFADIGSSVVAVDPNLSSTLAVHLNRGKRIVSDSPAVHKAIAAANLIICEGRPSKLQARREDPDALRRINPSAAIVVISPFGLSGPKAEDPAADLTLSFASGIARMLTGQVDDLAEPPIRPVGEQSAFIGGIAAACGGMNAVLIGRAEPGPVIDVSIQEALATLAISELARAGLTGRIWSRRRIADGNGATVCILPTRDGYVAISPRDDHQWAAWLRVMGSPDWGADPRFARKPDRVANWDALYALMSAWSQQHDKQMIANMAQAAHVPSFPLREPIEQLTSAQLVHRKFFRSADVGGRTIKVPASPFGLTIRSGNYGSSPTRPLSPKLPLAGVRVLDFSWVIAGPTATRYLAAMGAEVIKFEAPGRGDPGRASELHTILGQAKRSIVLDLKKPQAVALAREFAAKSDVLIENFATGVMDRLGLGAAALQDVNPRLIYVSASGLGRTGPEAQAVAYGTLLQCYAGFAGLNRHSGVPPRVGFAWLDPMCGLMLAFITAAALWQRQHHGNVARVDFSMLEAMLWTMMGPLIDAQLGVRPKPLGNRSENYAPHGTYRCLGEDEWVSLAVRDDEQWARLCDAVPDLSAFAGFARAQRIAQSEAMDRVLAAWSRPQAASAAAATLVRAGVPAAALYSSADLARCEHLGQRGFWDTDPAGIQPGLPWRANFGRVFGAAPGLGADTEAVLRDVLALSPASIESLRNSGAFG